jgi:hypothetical protein
MIYPGFCGQSYASTSFQLDAEECFNLFPEIINLPGVTPKSKIILRRRPGYSLLQTIADSPGRGKFSLNGRDFAVVGASFVEILSPTTSVVRGVVPSGTSPALWAATQTQIVVVVGGLGYCYNLASNAFQQIPTNGGFPPNCISICSLDTYFVALGANTNEFSLSGLLDGLTWAAIDFGSSQEPDNAVAIVNCHGYLWILGENETVLFQDSGNASFPLTRVNGSQIEQGCGATNSVAVLDNTLLWLGQDAHGAAVVYRADGQIPTRVSTEAVEAAIQGYTRYDDAVAAVYQRDGHLFYSLHFPTANTTWTYDLSTQMWHRRGWWNTTSGTWSADLGRYVSYAFGKHIVCDYTNGNIYEMTRAAATDGGNPLRWLRVAPYVVAEAKRLFFRWFQVDLQVGGGLPGNVDPQIMIRWTNDGGSTWSSYRQASCGKTGEYLKRVITRMCGSSRSRAFEVSGTDPIPDLAIFEAYIGVEKGLS